MIGSVVSGDGVPLIAADFKPAGSHPGLLAGWPPFRALLFTPCLQDGEFFLLSFRFWVSSLSKVCFP